MEHDFVINDRIFVRSFVKGKNIRLLMFSIRFTTSFEVSAVASVLAASGGNEIGPVTELLAHLSCEVQVRHVDGDANS